MRNKKGVSISMNTLIIAAIALIVLIVLIAIFMGRIGYFSENYDETHETVGSTVCWSQPGVCRDVTATCTEVTSTGGTWTDCSSSQKCCQIVGG